MANGKNWRGRLTAVLLAALTACSTAKVNTAPEAVLAVLAPPVPRAPAMEPVSFEDREGGLWLSYENYRALERNVIAMREYAGRLEAVIEFYREGADAD